MSREVECKPLSEWRSVGVELLGTQTRFVPGRRWRHRVIECGDADGDPIIMLHGIGGHAETWARNLRNLAARGLHVYAADMLHHGFTDKEPYDDEHRIKLQVDALADLVGALGHDRVHVEGTSLGAVVACDFALRYPELCKKVILNTGFGSVNLKRNDFRTDSRNTSENAEELRELSIRSVTEPTFETMRKRMEWLVADPERMTDDMVDIRLRIYSFPDVYASMQNIYFIGRSWLHVKPWNEEDLQDFEPEVLVFWSEHNPGQGVDYAEYVTGLIPHAQLYVMPDAGHWNHWEKPELHDEVVLQFLQTEPRALH